jgi:hypothetical protein
MKIIDFERKGNVVRFYLGEKTKKWGWTNLDYEYPTGKTPDWLKPSDTYYGDDWDDRPYELNAGRVYDEFIKGHKDIAFGFDDIVLEPCDSGFGSEYSKDDMIDRKIPCVIVVSKADLDAQDISLWEIEDNFERALELDGTKKFYFGDELNPD